MVYKLEYTIKAANKNIECHAIWRYEEGDLFPAMRSKRFAQFDSANGRCSAETQALIKIINEVSALNLKMQIKEIHATPNKYGVGGEASIYTFGIGKKYFHQFKNDAGMMCRNLTHIGFTNGIVVNGNWLGSLCLYVSYEKNETELHVFSPVQSALMDSIGHAQIGNYICRLPSGEITINKETAARIKQQLTGRAIEDMATVNRAVATRLIQDCTGIPFKYKGGAWMYQTEDLAEQVKVKIVYGRTADYAGGRGWKVFFSTT